MTEVKVTLVVPVRDEEDSLPRLVQSIERQTHAPDAVIFVDGGSVDGTLQLLRSWCLERDSWRVLELGLASPGSGRNAGIASATTEWVALTDAGIELDPHWLGRLVRVAAAGAVDVVYGHYEPVGDSHFTTSAALAYVGSPTLTERGPVRTRSIGSCLLRRSLWQRVGGFPDLRAAEDLLFMRRVDESGARVAIAPEAVVHWRLQPDLRSTFRRFRTYSKVNAQIGEQRNWHYGIARMYLAAMPFVLLVARRGRRPWLLVPLAGGLGRVGRGIWRRRQGRGPLWATNPLRFLTVAAIVVTVDVATFAGWADALAERGRAG